ncbi:DNA mismatch repair protein MutS [Spinellus fusiger]|nr:DNA mismatch repair protein MutS [Spinellus fusiger]
MTNENKLCIVQGRHPIQELCVNTFIPNDTSLSSDDSLENKASFFSNVSTSSKRTTSANHDKRQENVMILSGANFSGKSVYLKQVALITYMAHIGSFVPAFKATIGLSDRLFTRIQTSETISQVQSAFASDLQQLLQAIRYCTPRSLIIIDEFGKGTATTDGASLFCAVLEYFLSKPNQCPKIVASTHFHNMLSQSLFKSYYSIRFYTTEILHSTLKSETESSTCSERNRFSESSSLESIVFLYRIVPGVGLGASYGAWCATLGGIDTKIVNRATHLSNMIHNQQPIDPIENESETRRFEQLKILAVEFLASIGAGEMKKVVASVNRLFPVSKPEEE